MPVIFSDFLVSNEMSGYTENNSTTIFIVHELFLSYKLFKVYRNNMDHPVLLPHVDKRRHLVNPPPRLSI